MTNPDPNHMIKYCGEVLPGLLIDACEVDAELARRIGADVLMRAEAFATLSQREQDIVIAPFVEEVFDHRPLDAPLDLKTKVTLVVRNSLLEQAHHDGPLASGIITVTEYAAGALSHFLARASARTRGLPGPEPVRRVGYSLSRAWACLEALTEAFAEGGRQPLRLPTAPIPDLPTGDEITTASSTTHSQSAMVFSAIDPRFDQHLLGLLSKATSADYVLCTSALSRYSRNTEKLHRILEYLLAHNATVLTTNYLIRPPTYGYAAATSSNPTAATPMRASLKPADWPAPTASSPKPSPPNCGQESAKHTGPVRSDDLYNLHDSHPPQSSSR